MVVLSRPTTNALAAYNDSFALKALLALTYS
jgi:hypothetical protein